MSPLGRFGAAVALVVVGAPTARAAITDYLGKPIASVRLVVDGRDTTEPALLGVLETRVGRPLAMADVRASMTHLFSFGRFEDVQVDASLVGPGVALLYQLRQVHPVAKIEFAGLLDANGIDRGELRRRVESRYGASPPVGRAAELARTIEETLHEKGFLHPHVMPRVDLHDPGRATLVFTIDPGPRTVIGSVDIEVIGVNGGPSREAVSSAIGLRVGAPYQPDAVQARIDRYIQARRRQGYYEAKVTISPVRLSDDDRVAHLMLDVDPGPHVRVVFRGDPLPADKRDELVPVQREGAVDEDLLDDSRNRIEAYLRTQGYHEASASYTREAPAGELLITFDVKRGPQYRVEQVDITGNASIPLPDLVTSQQIRDGQPFSGARLDADVATIEAIYRRRGFASVKVVPQFVPKTGEVTAGHVPVDVRIAIDEGVRTIVGAVRIVGNGSVPEQTLMRGLGLQPGRQYFPPQLAADRDGIQRKYDDLGYRNATVQASPGLSADRSRAEPVFTVQEGPRLVVDHVMIVGNIRVSSETIQRALQIKAGDPLGEAAVEEAQSRLATLGLFRRVRIAEVQHGDENQRDLLVTVEEAPATTIEYGGGGEVRLRVVSVAGIATQRLEFAPRATFAIGRNNLFGKNRSVSLFGSASLNPKDLPSFAGQSAPASSGGFGFTEYLVQGTYREPRLFDTSADAQVTATIEQQIRSSFNFARRAVTAELARHLTRHVSVSGNYQIQRDRVFDEAVDLTDQLLIDRLFPQVLLSSFSASIIRDTRDDRVDTTRGEYVSLYGQLAARAIGSDVGLVKTQVTAQMFRTLPGTTRTVFAASARIGLATGFPRDVVETDAQGNVVLGANGQPVVEVVDELPEAERFFAGGDTTVRGFALDTLGTPQTIVNGFPIGGNGDVIFNAELRVPVRGGLGVVGFLDTGNVFARVPDISLVELRSAVGFGLRYKSPVGPIRVDLGFKLHREQIVPGQLESLTALNISFGQAF